MRRLSTLFLVCFLAVLAGLSGVVAWKIVGRRTPAPVQQPPQQAEYQIKDVHINETLDGNLRWTLNADQAEVYDQKGITVMRKVVIQVFSRDGDWTVTSDEGTLDNNRRNVTLTGNVVIRSSDGLEMRTATLGWDNEHRVLASRRHRGDQPGGHDDHRNGARGPHAGGDRGRPPERPGRDH
jgi:LPS export ABC transporter protein LptC